MFVGLFSVLWSFSTTFGRIVALSSSCFIFIFYLTVVVAAEFDPREYDDAVSVIWRPFQLFSELPSGFLMMIGAEETPYMV